MKTLTTQQRELLIQQIGDASTRLKEAANGPIQDAFREDLRRLVRLLWLDGQADV
jgi:hypothetical protein